jgi:hypothetical protein
MCITGNDDDTSISSEKLRNIENIIQGIGEDKYEGQCEDEFHIECIEGDVNREEPTELDQLVEKLDPLPTIQYEEGEVFSGEEPTDSEEDIEEAIINVPKEDPPIDEPLQFEELDENERVDNQDIDEEVEEDVEDLEDLEDVEETEVGLNEVVDAVFGEVSEIEMHQQVLGNEPNFIPPDDESDSVQLTYVDLMSKTVKDLREVAKAKSVSTRGTKEILVQKILSN